MRPRSRRCKDDLLTCQDCKSVLTDENWSPSMQKNRRYVCRPCWTARQARYNANDPNFREKQNSRRKKAVASWTPERHEKEWRRRYGNVLKKKYGITIEEYEDMLKAQDSKCYICHSEDSKGMGSFHVDHCHNTGRVRRLLCTSCNMMLGLAKDDVELLKRAITYLEEH